MSRQGFCSVSDIDVIISKKPCRFVYIFFSRQGFQSKPCRDLAATVGCRGNAAMNDFNMLVQMKMFALKVAAMRQLINSNS